MKKYLHTPAGKSFTELVLEVFRLNGVLLAAGDGLLDDLGLTSARWQVLGAMHLYGDASVSQVARRMGLTRQGVQRIADRLVLDGFAMTRPNPDHIRAKLYSISPHGREVMEEVGQRQAAWANAIVAAFSVEELDAAVALLEQLRSRVQAGKS